MTRGTLLLAVAAAAAWTSPPAAAAGVTDLKAFYRDGQTFITWKEVGGTPKAWYAVYRHDEPITAETLAKAARIAKVPAGSNRWGFFRNVNTSKGFFKALAAEPWAKGIQIADDPAGGKQLPDGTGLLVWTIRQAGRRYYAVTVESGGREDRSIQAGANSLAQPVAEKVEPVGAVCQRKLADRYWIYAFFCDYATWNPDGVDDNWDGYAHVFHIRAPDPKRKGTGEPYPVSFRLHAFGAWPDWNIRYCYPATHVDVRLLDYHLTWWYGYSDALPALDPKTRVPPKGRVVNFTEQRVLQVARWLRRNPGNFPHKVDPEQFSVFGGSMGGTGTHTVGTRHGDLWAGAFPDEGIFNWGMPARHNRWLNDVRRKYGPLDRNDPTNEGPGVYDVLNLPKWVVAHSERELPFLSIGQGMLDTVIPFHGYPEYLRALEAGKHPFAAGWELMGHMPWAGSGSPMDYKRIRRDEIAPAFADASCNSPLRSGFRIFGKAEGFGPKTLTIKAGSLKGQYVDKGSFPKNLAGKTLVVGPSGSSRTFFRIAANTATELTVAEGNLAEHLPPLTSWDLHVMRQAIKKAEGKDRQPNEAEKKAKALARKASFLVCDGDPRGCWNGHFAWSTRNQNFDPKQAGDDLADTPKRLAICMRVVPHRRSAWSGDSATADVTPRRARQFKPKPGETVHWENWDCSDPAKPRKVAEGEVKADAHGLVTVKRFIIGKAGWGNRLVLTRK